MTKFHVGNAYKAFELACEDIRFPSLFVAGNVSEALIGRRSSYIVLDIVYE